VNVLKALFLTLAAAAGFIFLFQNTHVLDSRTSLVLDLWWVQFTSPQLVFYWFVFLCFVFGIVFGAFAFFPGNKELRKSLKLLRARIRALTQEITTMHKKDEFTEEKIEDGQATGPEEVKDSGPEPEPQFQPEEAVVDREVMVKTTEASGKSALVGVFALFILLVAFYFYIDQKISGIQSHMEQSVEKSELAARMAQEAIENSEVFREELQAVSMSLKEHEKEISALRSLPQDTMDQMTMMQVNDYLAGIDQLVQRAATEQDRELLEAVRDSLSKALEHYREKAD
jgi:uncharacterized integral membrane protein